MVKHKKLLEWVKEIEELCQPDKVYWCDGSEEENERLIQEAVESGSAIPLNPKNALAAIFPEPSLRRGQG